MIQYCLINLLNNDKDTPDIINCVQQNSYSKFKSGLKCGIIDKYSDKCEVLECTTCEFINVLINFSTLFEDALGSVFTYSVYANHRY